MSMSIRTCLRPAKFVPALRVTLLHSVESRRENRGVISLLSAKEKREYDGIVRGLTSLWREFDQIVQLETFANLARHVVKPVGARNLQSASRVRGEHVLDLPRENQLVINGCRLSSGQTRVLYLKFGLSVVYEDSPSPNLIWK